MDKFEIQNDVSEQGNWDQGDEDTMQHTLDSMFG